MDEKIRRLRSIIWKAYSRCVFVDNVFHFIPRGKSDYGYFKAMTKWTAHCESREIRMFWDPERSCCQVTDEFVIIPDPSSLGYWLEMSKETADKIIFLE